MTSKFIHFLNRKGIDLIVYVEAANILSIAFDYINDIVFVDIFTYEYFSIMDTIGMKYAINEVCWVIT